MSGEANAGIPPPLDGDDDDVAWALQTAAVQWKRGAFADAIVWLRRAVDSAIQAGQAERASDLSGAAWRLTERMLAQADAVITAPPASEPNDVDDLLSNMPAPPSGDIVSIEFEATRTIPDPDTERKLTPAPPPSLPPPSVPISVEVDEESTEAIQRGSFPGHHATRRSSAPAPRAMRPPPPPRDVRAAPAAERKPSRAPRPPVPPPPPPPPPIEEPMALPRFASEPTLDLRDEQTASGMSFDDTTSAQLELPTEAPPPGYSPFSEAPLEDDGRPTETPPPDESLLTEGPPPNFDSPIDLPPAPVQRVPSAPAPKPRAKLKPTPAPPPPPPPPPEPEPEPEPEAPQAPAAGADSEIAGISLADVRALQDLPEEAQQELVAKARLEYLARADELTGFGIALVVEGEVSIMPAIADVPCARASAGEVVCTTGTLADGVMLSVVASQDGTIVAVWDAEALELATADCPWVADELKVVADRLQTLAGVTMGAMGDRLDEMLRVMITERCEVRTLAPYEILVEKDGVVPGMHIVGAGRIEIIEGEGEDAELIDEYGPGDFLFAAQVLQGGTAPSTARAGKTGALVLFAERKTAHDLLLSVPPLLEIFAT
jgi:hypothetical protein